jgi:hypothetical protein
MALNITIRISLYNVRMYKTILAVNHGRKIGDLLGCNLGCKKWPFCYLRDYNFCVGNGKNHFFLVCAAFLYKKK